MLKVGPMMLVEQGKPEVDTYTLACVAPDVHRERLKVVLTGRDHYKPRKHQQALFLSSTISLN